jgi:SLOG cluster2
MPRKDIVVGLSVSEPDADELVSLGLSQMHVRHAFIEIVRHILARGWAVAYGGDLRAAGYTEALFDLVRTYDPAHLPGPDRVLAYLAWPIWLDVTDAQRAELANVATIKQVARPDGAPATLPVLTDRQPDDLLWSSLALTKMRVLMNSEIGARVVLGGRVHGQQGLYPGVAEEAALALRSGVPLYVAGGFGGCGRLVVSSRNGLRPPIELSVEYQLEHTPRYAELLDAATSAGWPPSFSDMIDAFTAASTDGFNNGLDEHENGHLLATDDVDEVIALVLRGLRHVTALD